MDSCLGKFQVQAIRSQVHTTQGEKCENRTSRYSSRPYLEPSRPSPDCFIPPKGATYCRPHRMHHEFEKDLSRIAYK